MPGPERPQTVQLRGMGGALWTFDLPLDTHMLRQVRKGELRPADGESAKRLAAAGITSSPAAANLKGSS